MARRCNFTGVVDKKLLQQAYNFVVSNELTCLRLHPLGLIGQSKPFRVINSVNHIALQYTGVFGMWQL